MSFRHKLVLYFSVLALLPLAVTFYGYRTIAVRSKLDQTDARLVAELRAAAAAYDLQARAASESALRLARNSDVQDGIVRGDRVRLEVLAAGTPGATIRTPTFAVGSNSPSGLRRSVQVKRGNRVLGTVSVNVPLSDTLANQLGTSFASGDRLAIIHNGVVRAGAAGGSRIDLPRGIAETLRISGAPYRVISTSSLAHSHGVSLAVLTPEHEITNSIDTTQRKLALALVACLLLIGVTTYLIGRSIVQTLRRFVAATNAIVDGHLNVRVPVAGRDEFNQLATAFNRMTAQLEERQAEVLAERRRVQDVATGFAQALAATHDETSLLRVVAESSVQATGGTGGIVTRNGNEIVRVGEPDLGAEHLLFPLRAAASDYGSLLVYGTDFDSDGVELGAAIAKQAVTALENARLHQVVEQQALADQVTGLANRRSIDETLQSELLSAARSNKQCALVLADLDHFKRVNDLHGHPTGDEVLLAFAAVLRDVIRARDLAGRWGGEEFALVLVETDTNGGMRLAERARLRLEALRLTSDDGKQIRVTASFGVASYPDFRTVDALVAAADEALYRAKREGRNRVAAAQRRSHLSH
jgi:diguanylate cyclase (GGDEF)-like protein